MPEQSPKKSHEVMILLNKVEDQIRWHDEKAISNKLWYIRIRILNVVIAVSISVLSVITLIIEMRYAPIYTAVLAGCITLLETVSNLFQFDKFHLIYRFTCEQLKTEKTRFEAGLITYKELAEQTDLLLSDTVEAWHTTSKKRN